MKHYFSQEAELKDILREIYINTYIQKYVESFEIFGLQIQFFQSDSLQCRCYVSIEMQQDKYIPIKPLYLLSFLEVNFYTKPYYFAELFLLDRKVKRLTRGQFLTMHVTTPPTESPFTRTASIAAIIFSAYSGSGHRTMLLSIWTNFKTQWQTRNLASEMQENIIIATAIIISRSHNNNEPIVKTAASKCLNRKEHCKNSMQSYQQLQLFGQNTRESMTD